MSFCAWPPDKYVTHANGSIECVDCHIVTFTFHDFNIHDCSLGMKMRRSAEAKTASTAIPPTPPIKQTFTEVAKERWF